MTTAELPATLTRDPNSARPKTPSGRERILWEIAERYRELVEPVGASGIPGSGDHTPGMPRTYTATVREFERLYRLMRDDRTEPLIQLEHGKVSVRRLAWHLRAWHLDAERVIRHRPLVDKRGRRTMDADGRVATRPELATRRHPDAREHLARAAVGWMADRWGLVTEPMLPDELRIAA